MIENGGKEPSFNVDKIIAFEVTSYSAIEYTELQSAGEGFPKSFPKLLTELLTKLVPSYFQDSDRNSIETILQNLVEPKSAKELALIMSCSTRTLKDKYLDKMIQAGAIAMTIPDKPNSNKQKYKLVTDY